MGFPLAEPANVSGLESSTLGGCRVAAATFVGSYDGLSAAHDAVGMWLHERGMAPAGNNWEVYVERDENPDASVTELYWPLR